MPGALRLYAKADSRRLLAFTRTDILNYLLYSEEPPPEGSGDLMIAVNPSAEPQ
jgi:hypothetical protein